MARAGRSGTAYSLVCNDELPYVLDVHLFLMRPLTFATDQTQQGELNIKNNEEFELPASEVVFFQV